ncbi:substance-P receptor [Magallana gigas]|uniref:substance-P receptor n=1 Tax=Magallana gigas TaxID=29159 RepID=UPI003340FC47
MGLTLDAGIFLVCMVLILIFAVVSNFIVIFIVIRNKKMRSVTNVFIGNLAFSDIFLGAVVLPMRLHDLSHAENFHEGEFMCRVINGFPILCITSSIFTLVAVSFERKQSIVHSLGPQMTLGTCRKLVIAMWVGAFLVATPSFVEYDVITIPLSHNETMESCRSTFSSTLSIFNGLCVLLLSYVIPLIIMWYNYFLIIKFVMRKTSTVQKSTAIKSSQNKSQTHKEANQEMSARNLSNGNLTTISTTESKASTSKLEANQRTEQHQKLNKSVLSEKRMKIIQMLIVVAVLFAISWLPYFVSLVIAKINGSDDSEDAKGAFNLIMLFLATFSTGYNVIVYVIFNPNFRKAILYIICFRKFRKNKVWVDSEYRSKNKMPVSSAGQTTDNH